MIQCPVIEKKEKKLLVLDLNGILADFVDNPPPPNYTPLLQISGKSVFKRPFCLDFLQFCFNHFQVAVWSSRMRGMDRLVDLLFGDMKYQLLFCWDQSWCTQPGLTIGQLKIKTDEKKQKSLFLKELKKIWMIGEYNESNTLLLDDSPYKSMFNPPYTAVFPTSYTIQNEYDNSLGPGGDIRVYLEGLAMAENVQMYVEQHPFEQAPIDQFSDLYQRVLSKIKNNELKGRRGISYNQSQQGVLNVKKKYEHPNKSFERKYTNRQSIGHGSTSSNAEEWETLKGNFGGNQSYGSEASIIRGRWQDVKARGRGHPSVAIAPEQNSRGRGNTGFDSVRSTRVSETQTLNHTISADNPNKSFERKYSNRQSIGHGSTSSNAGEWETPKGNFGGNQSYDSEAPIIRGRWQGVKARGRGHPSVAIAPEQNSRGRGNTGFDSVQSIRVSETQTLDHTISVDNPNKSFERKYSNRQSIGHGSTSSNAGEWETPKGNFGGNQSYGSEAPIIRGRWQGVKARGREHPSVAIAPEQNSRGRGNTGFDSVQSIRVAETQTLNHTISVNNPNKSFERKYTNRQSIGHGSTSSNAGEWETLKGNFGGNQSYDSEASIIRGRWQGVKARGRGCPSVAIAREQYSRGKGKQTRGWGRENTGFDSVQSTRVSETQTLNHTIPNKDGLTV